MAQYQVAEANVRAFIHEDADEQASINLIKQSIGTRVWCALYTIRKYYFFGFLVFVCS
jgi:hypothetical protein